MGRSQLFHSTDISNHRFQFAAVPYHPVVDHQFIDLRLPEGGGTGCIEIFGALEYTRTLALEHTSRDTGLKPSIANDLQMITQFGGIDQWFGTSALRAI